MKSLLRTGLFLLLLLGAALGTACADLPDLSGGATVYLTVETEAETFEVSASYGTVEGSGTQYTVTLEEKRPVLITVSAAGYETENLPVRVSDLVTGSHRATVSFGKPRLLDVTIRVSGARETAEVRVGSVPLGQKTDGTFFGAFSAAELEQGISVSADGMCERTLIPSEEELASKRLYSAAVTLVPEGKRLIEFVFDDPVYEWFAVDAKNAYQQMQWSRTGNGARAAYVVDQSYSGKIFFYDQDLSVVAQSEITPSSEAYGTEILFGIQASPRQLTGLDPEGPLSGMRIWAENPDGTLRDTSLQWSGGECVLWEKDLAAVWFFSERGDRAYRVPAGNGETIACDAPQENPVVGMFLDNLTGERETQVFGLSCRIGETETPVAFTDGSFAWSPDAEYFLGDERIVSDGDLLYRDGNLCHVFGTGAPYEIRVHASRADGGSLAGWTVKAFGEQRELGENGEAVFSDRRQSVFRQPDSAFETVFVGPAGENFRLRPVRKVIDAERRTLHLFVEIPERTPLLFQCYGARITGVSASDPDVNLHFLGNGRYYLEVPYRRDFTLSVNYEDERTGREQTWQREVAFSDLTWLYSNRLTVDLSGEASAEIF